MIRRGVTVLLIFFLAIALFTINTQTKNVEANSIQNQIGQEGCPGWFLQDDPDAGEQGHYYADFGGGGGPLCCSGVATVDAGEGTCVATDTKKFSNENWGNKNNQCDETNQCEDQPDIVTGCPDDYPIQVGQGPDITRYCTFTQIESQFFDCEEGTYDIISEQMAEFYICEPECNFQTEDECNNAPNCGWEATGQAYSPNNGEFVGNIYDFQNQSTQMENALICADNRAQGASDFYHEGSISLPEQDFVIRTAQDFPGRVMHIGGDFTASDGEQWLTCGFDSDGKPDYQLIPGETSNLINTTGDATFPYNGVGQLMCYKTGQGATYPFKECCASDECLNSNNELLEDEQYRFGENYYTRVSGNLYELLPSEQTLAFSGGPNQGEEKYKIETRDMDETSIWNTYWFKYTHLEFLILANDHYDGQLRATFDSSSNTINIDDFKSPPLTEPDENNRAWYNVRIPTENLQGQSQADLESFEFTAMNEEGIPFNLDISHMILVESPSSSSFVETTICSASGEWIDDINDDQATCEEHPVYGWTGSHCCGSNQYHDNDFDETYIEEGLLCEAGMVKESNTIMNNPRILFYEGETYSCGETQQVTFSWEGSVAVEEDVDTDETIDFLESVGTKYRCGVDGVWTDQFEAQRASILASALNRVGNKSGNYHLFCGPEEVVRGVNENLHDGFTEHLCHLVKYDRRMGNVEQPDTTTGVVLLPEHAEDEVYEAEDFFQALRSDYVALNNIDDDQSLSCDDEEGFVECLIPGAGPYKFHFDNEFGLFVATTSQNLFGGFSFWDNIFSWWDGLIDFIFGSGEEPQPVELQLDGRNVFVSKVADKTITGFYDEDNDFIRVDYYNIDESSFDEHLEIYLYNDVTLINKSYSDSHAFVEVSTVATGEFESYETWKAITSVTRLEGS